MIGRTLAHYRITAAIGAGGMGEVYLAEDTSAHSYVAPYNLAAIYAGLGEKDQAFAWLDRAYADRSGFLAFYFTTDTRLDNLRSDPRFAELLRRVGLPQPR